MYVILRNGTVIEFARIHAAGPGTRGMAFAIGGTELVAWYSEEDIQLIRFDRDMVNDAVPLPGPDDFTIGTRHVDPQ